MPYTPPSRSPASSKPTSPILTRNQSYDVSLLHVERPGLPRSRSATYLQKHRRTPSIADHEAHGHSTSAKPHWDSTVGNPGHGASALSPIPVTASFESPVISDDDEEGGRGRKLRDLAVSLKETMVITKRPSPTREETNGMSSQSSRTPTILTIRPPSPALTPEARKISHSRSASDMDLSKLVDLSSQAASSDDSDDDEGLHIKPPLLRKKSGELVKPALRAASRRRPCSMPGTPTFSKAVHFNVEIEQVRHFLMVDRPIAVSAGSSPVETYDSEGEYPFGYDDGYKSNMVDWEIRTPNFPRDSVDRSWHAVRVERIFLAADKKTLVGSVAVANWGFQKWVVARFTLDYWKTTSEVVCEYNNDVRKKLANDGYDRFNFNIKLSDQANLETKTLLLCIRYNVNGHDHWDSNNNMNYQVDFIKKTTAKPSKQGTTAGASGAIPRSRHSPSSIVRPRSFPASGDDDFSAGFAFDKNTTILKSPRKATGPLSKSSVRNGDVFPIQPRKPQHGGAFATRYDFGASLSAALSNAQVQLGEKKPAQLKAVDYFSNSGSDKSVAPAVQPVPDSSGVKVNSSTRPELGSQEYHDLIQKYCYFGSKQGSPGTMSPDPYGPSTVPQALVKQLGQKRGSQMDGVDPVTISSSSDTSALNSVRDSASNSPTSPPLDKHQYDGAHDSHHSSRSATPTFHTTSPRLLAQYRSASPALFELPHHVMAQ